MENRKNEAKSEAKSGALAEIVKIDRVNLYIASSYRSPKQTHGSYGWAVDMTCRDSKGNWSKPEYEKHEIVPFDGSDMGSRKLALQAGLRKIAPPSEDANWELWIYTTETDEEIEKQTSRWTQFVTICETSLPKWAAAGWAKSGGEPVDDGWKELYRMLSKFPHRFIVGSEKEKDISCKPGNSYRRWFWEEFNKH